MASQIPEMEYTKIEAIPDMVAGLRKTFRTQKTRPLEYRLVQLRKLWWGLHDNEALLLEALKRDLNKSRLESVFTELGWIKSDIVHICNNLKKWMKDEPLEDTPIFFKFNCPKFRKEPMGTVLVIGAFNFPVFLSLGPFIGTIAAGCTAVLKPSESSPATAMVLQKIITEYLDPAAYTCAQGGIPETSALLDQKWDKICFTGSPRTGSIIAKKAAETLTPVMLELGGRNPAILARHANPKLAARRLLWGKIMNAGQICLSQNYILVDEALVPEFISAFKDAYREFYPKGALNDPDYARIVNQREFDRIRTMLNNTQGQILHGGAIDEATLRIEPTLVQVSSPTDSLIKDESFGPLIPILPVKDLDEAIEIARAVDPTPLACYPFGNDAEVRRVLDATLSGGASVNDAYMHASILTAPLGGVGSSGTGSHHARFSFDAFTHKRIVTVTPAWMEPFLAARYPPYTESKLKQLLFMSEVKADFDREGRVHWSWLSTLLGLGGKGTGAFARWAVVVALAVLLKKYGVQGRLN